MNTNKLERDIIVLLGCAEVANNAVRCDGLRCSKNAFYILKSISLYYIVQQIKKGNLPNITYKITGVQKNENHDSMYFSIDFKYKNRYYTFCQPFVSKIPYNALFQLVKPELEAISVIDRHLPKPSLHGSANGIFQKAFIKMLCIHHDHRWACMDGWSDDEWFVVMKLFYWNITLEKINLPFTYSLVNIKTEDKTYSVTFRELRCSPDKYFSYLMGCFVTNTNKKIVKQDYRALFYQNINNKDFLKGRWFRRFF
jgi:hypothetical protein